MLQTFFDDSCKYQHFFSYPQKSEFQIRHPYKGAESTGCLVFLVSGFIFESIAMLRKDLMSFLKTEDPLKKNFKDLSDDEKLEKMREFFSLAITLDHGLQVLHPGCKNALKEPC